MVHGTAKTVLCGPNITEPILFHHGQTTYRVGWLSEHAAGILKKKDVWWGRDQSRFRSLSWKKWGSGLVGWTHILQHVSSTASGKPPPSPPTEMDCVEPVDRKWWNTLSHLNFIGSVAWEVTLTVYWWATFPWYAILSLVTAVFIKARSWPGISAFKAFSSDWKEGLSSGLSLQHLLMFCVYGWNR